MFRMSRHRWNFVSQGQSLVELALLLPLIALLLVGIFDLGRAFHALITINNAGREAARYGTLHDSDGTGMCRSAYQEMTNSGITVNLATVTISCPIPSPSPSTITCPLPNNPNPAPAISCPRDQAIQVRVRYIYNPMLGFFFSSGIPIRSSVEMRVP
jgi:Flp pilus assembly protein TadG